MTSGQHGRAPCRLSMPRARGAATYRVEVRLEGAPGEPPVPWIVGNPIYVTRGEAPAVEVVPPRVVGQRMFDDGSGLVGGGSSGTLSVRAASRLIQHFTSDCGFHGASRKGRA